MIKRFFKRLLLATIIGSVSLPVLAQETIPSMDTTSTINAATAVSTGLQSILTSLAPLVIGVVVAGVAIWAIPRIVGLLKSAFTSGKGR